MKKYLVLIYSLLIVISSFANSSWNIDEKLLHTFQASFPRAEKVTWNELSNVYVVSFVDNGILSRVMYQKKGDAIASYIRYYQEENLPVNIRSGIKHQHPGKKIWGVVEVSVPDNTGDADTEGILTTFYYIKLETAKTWITVKVSSDGNSEVVEKYKKTL